MNTQEKIQIASMVVLIIGWPVSGFIGYRLGLRSQRIAREFAAKDAAHGRIRAFADSVSQLRAVVANPDPANWVVHFQKSTPTLQAAFYGISGDLTPSDRLAARAIIDEIVALSRLTPADIYEREDQICQNLEGFEKCVRAT